MVRFTGRAASTLLVGCALGAATLAGTVSSPANHLTTDRYRLVLDDQPTNAAKVFKWGLSAWEDEFRPEVLFNSDRWESNQPSAVGQQVGMLTLKAGSTPETVWTEARDGVHQYGRWEARVRTRVFDRGGQPYHVSFELVPDKGYHCGAKNIVVASYYPGQPMVQGYVRTLPDNEFRFSDDPEATTEEFHTFAIEITPDHISWFVDKHVLMTERRPEALSGRHYHVRFEMEGSSDPSAQMNESWLQMDWVRYYTLKRPDALPITAPQAEETTYDGAC
jgi:hypothetical protein